MPLQTLTVNVLKEDIEFGRQRNCSYCPVALAIKRVTVNPNIVTVGATQLHLFNRGKILALPIPRVAVKFIAAFDDGKSVSPFSFTLELR